MYGGQVSFHIINPRVNPLDGFQEHWFKTDEGRTNHGRPRDESISAMEQHKAELKRVL